MGWAVLILFDAFILSMKDIFIKNCLKKEHALPSLFWMCLCVTLLSLFFIHDITFILSNNLLLLIFLKAIFLGFAWYFVYHALRRMEVSFVAPMKNISPVFLVILSFFILGERLGMLQYLGVFVILCGSYFLELNDPKKILQPFALLKDKRFVLLLVALLLVSFCGIIDKVVMAEANFQTYIFYTYLFLTLFYLSFMMIKGFTKELLIAPMKEYYYIIILIALAGFFADIIYFFVVAIPTLPISLIIPMKRSSGLFTTILGGNILHEHNIMQKAFASGIMIIGLFLLFV